MQTSRLIVAGHSHATALGVPPSGGAAIAGVSAVPHPDARVFAVGGSWPRDEAYWTELVAASVDATPVIAWDGNQHQAYFLFEPHPPFDFVLSSDPACPVATERALVPEAYLRAFIAPTLEPLAALLAAMAAAGGERAIVVGTPPPKGDQALIRKLLEHEPHFVRAAAAVNASIASVPLTEPALMHKLWSLVQDMTREVAEAGGAVFVPVPAAACTAEGFLRREYWSTDVTHANPAFGALMLAGAIATADAMLARAGAPA